MKIVSSVALEFLGCRLNQAENETLARQFLSQGYELAESPTYADIYVLNTCTVTHIAERKARHLLRKARRSNSNAVIVATGCYAQRAPEELRQLGVVDLVVGNEGKFYLLETLNHLSEDEHEEEASVFLPGRTRSLIEIQRGCNDLCSFCIVPQVRGREYSLPAERILRGVKERVGAGYKEVILTGTKIGAYGQNGGSPAQLLCLIERILGETGVERLHLSSLQPQELTPQLLKLWGDLRLCPHLHIPLQSGSQSVLQRMRRRYSVADYKRAVSLVREIIPDVAVTTDVIVGFPGESEEEFEESYHFCERIDFANIHSFPYSARPGTVAAQMPDQVKPEVKRERSQRMLALARGSAQHFREHFLGQTMPVLWEGKVRGGIWSGHTDNYLRIFTQSDKELTNQIAWAKMIAGHEGGLWGKLVNKGG